jgi:hypothetical protein
MTTEKNNQIIIPRSQCPRWECIQQHKQQIQLCIPKWELIVATNATVQKGKI